MQEEHYEFGDVIVRQDDPADSFYILTRGRARALKIKPDGEEIPLGVLKPGDSFGEAALAEGGTRNATVRCSTGGRCPADRSQRFSRARPTRARVKTLCRDDRTQSGAAKFPLSVQQLRPAADRCVAQHDRQIKTSGLEKGNLIIREGDDAGPLYILQKGRARAFAGVNGKQRNLAFYREGDFFGELSILNGSPRAASVEAFTDCQLLALRAEWRSAICAVGFPSSKSC